MLCNSAGSAAHSHTLFSALSLCVDLHDYFGFICENNVLELILVAEAFCRKPQPFVLVFL